MIEKSNIFQPYRTIGNFCTNYGFCVEYYGANSFVTTSVGDLYHTYNCKKINLICVSDQCASPIKKIIPTGTGFLVCSHGSFVSIWKRGKRIGDLFKHSSDVIDILCMGDNVLSVDKSGSLVMWDFLTQCKCITYKIDVYFETMFTDNCQIMSWCHPPTYINKIILGLASGALWIWNIITWYIILLLTQTCALDILAIGVGGNLIFHNIKTDKTLFIFSSDLEDISHISFQNTAKFNSVAFCGKISDILVMDLDTRKLICTIPSHKGGIAGIEFLIGQPILVTAGADNKIKMWILDNPDGSARLLKSRTGHSGPTNKLRFIGNTGLSIISSSALSLRFTNCNRDEQSFEFSNGRPTKRWKSDKPVMRPTLPEIIDFNNSKEYFWETCVSCHRGISWVQTWNVINKTIGKKKLFSPHLKNQKPISVTLSPCGNSCLVGYDKGGLEVFNMESGSHRGSFIDNQPMRTPILGVVIDGRNYLCVSIDNPMCRIWFFNTRKIKARIELSIEPKKIEINRQSSLIVISGSSVIFIIDLETNQTIRRFQTPETSSLSDICLSQDSRWLIVSSNDSFIRVWDLPSSRLIDEFKTKKPVSSLAFSYKQEMLAFSYQDEPTINLFFNKTFYIDSLLVPVDFELNRCKSEKTINDSPDALSEKLATLSLLPPSRWRHLDKIDLIKERSKPKQPVQKLESAPFFIPTVPGIHLAFDIPETDAAKPPTKIRKNAGSVVLSKVLDNYFIDRNKAIVLKTLLQFSPNEIDIQIRCLVTPESTSPHLKHFIDILADLVADYRNFDFLQGVLSLSLIIHGDTLMDPIYHESLVRLKDLICIKWQSLNELSNQALAIVGFLRSSITHVELSAAEDIRLQGSDSIIGLPERIFWNNSELMNERDEP
ncbi:hypothetical protein HZS_6436, partial [Henneguya salminicola]